jgi:hypothetical protein
MFREAYERIGILGNLQTPNHIQSAILSANLELSSWVGKGLNLWMIKKEMQSLSPNKHIYELGRRTVRLLEVTSINPQRLLGGTAQSTRGGNPENCFDPNITTGCVQDLPNGSISYNFGDVNKSVVYVGILPLEEKFYTLEIFSSDSNESSKTVERSIGNFFYPAGKISWFVLENPSNAPIWGIEETGGGMLRIQQIYFCQPSNFGAGDRLLSPISRSEYMAISSKMNTGVPSGYYFNQRTNPTLTLWPVPAPNTSSALLYTSYEHAQDVTQMFESVNVPQRFYDAFICGLSARLALKFAPDRYQLLKQEAYESYQNAAKTDFENVPFRFTPDFTPYSS